MNIRLFPVLIITWLSILSPYHLFADEVPDEVNNAAQEGIRILVKSLPAQELPRFGFLNQQDVDDATVGPSFQSFDVDSNKLLNMPDGSDDLRSTLVPSEKWRFLIMSREKAAAILTLYKVNGKWKAGSIGSVGPATELNEVIRIWPPASGYQYRLIKSYKGRADFVELSSFDTIRGIIPLTSARHSMGERKKEFDPFDLRNGPDIANKIKNDEKQNYAPK